VPVGYADGYSRLLSGKAHMLVKGQRARVTGRVCMDFTMIDVGRIPDAAAGDEVVVLGTRGNETVSADELADLMGTINYEVVAGLTSRLPVCYRKQPTAVPRHTPDHEKQPHHGNIPENDRERSKKGAHP
jgi:alanine racemase